MCVSVQAVGVFVAAGEACESRVGSNCSVAAMRYYHMGHNHPPSLSNSPPFIRRGGELFF